MPRLFTIPPQNRDEIDYSIVSKIKANMFPEKAEKLIETLAWDDIDGIQFDMIDRGKFRAERFAGLLMKTYAGSTVIRKVMVKDGQIDIDKCLAKFEELKEIKRKADELNRQANARREKLSAEVGRFFQEIMPPPGFVIRLYPDDKWTLKYETSGLSWEQAARIVEAIREALK